MNFSYRNRKTPELSISSDIDVCKRIQKCDVIVRYGGYKYILTSYSISHNKLNYQPCYYVLTTLKKEAHGKKGVFVQNSIHS